MSSKKEILNALSYLKSGSIEEVEFPYEPTLNHRVYYFARKEGMTVSVVPRKNRWVVSLKESKRPIIAMRSKDCDLDILYSSAVLVKRELITIILFEKLTEEVFLSLEPAQQLFEGINIEFSSRGMELSLKSEEDKEQEELYDRED